MIDPPILGQSFCLNTFILKKRRFFAFHTPIATKKLPLHTPIETKFLLYTPQKTVHGKSNDSPPKKTTRTTLSSPWSVGCAADKKGSHFLQSSSAFSSSDYISRLLRRQSHPFFVLILRLCSLKYKDPSLLLCMLGIGGCCINRGGGFFFNLPSISDLAFRLSWRHCRMVVIFPVEGKSRWRRRNKTPSYTSYWQIKSISKKKNSNDCI